MKHPNILVAIIDTQYDFVMADGRLPIAGAESIIVPGIRFLKDLDPNEIAGVIATFDTHTAEKYLGSPENLGDPENGINGFPLHCEAGTPGWENVFNLQLISDEIPVWTLEKGVFDMWEEDERHTQIWPLTRKGDDGGNYWGKGRDFFFHGHPGPNGYDITARGYRLEHIDTVRVIGVASDFCVRWAIAGFLKRGYKVEVVGDLTAGILRDIERTVVDEFPGQVLVI